MPKTKSKNLAKTQKNKRSSTSIELSKRFSVSEDRFSFGLVVFGLILLSYFAIHRYLYSRSLQLSRAQVAIEEPGRSVRPAPTHIFIQWFVDSDIESMSLVDGNWAISPTKTSFLIQSARPGEAGNIILYGHNTRAILGNIRALKGYEHITLRTADGRDHMYKVSEMKEVDPSDVSWLQPTLTETLTMYTCSGFLDSKRFMVRAIPVQ